MTPDRYPFQWVEKRTLGVYDDGSARLLDLEFELPSGHVVRPGEKPGTVRVDGLRSQDGFHAELDPEMLADLAERFQGIGS